MESPDAIRDTDNDLEYRLGVLEGRYPPKMYKQSSARNLGELLSESFKKEDNTTPPPLSKMFKRDKDSPYLPPVNSSSALEEYLDKLTLLLQRLEEVNFLRKEIEEYKVASFRIIDILSYAYGMENSIRDHIYEIHRIRKLAHPREERLE